MSGPLEGLKVIDLTQGWAGPFCAMELGDLGAGVTKIEPPGGDFTRRIGPPFFKGESLPFLAVNRSKRSIVLDLEQPAGVAVLKRLVADADVVVESFTPGEADRLGIGEAALRQVNPRLIYATMTPFGQEGAYRDWAGSELVAQAMGSFTQFFGQPGGAPVMMGGDQANLMAGKYLFHGVMAALLHRERSGVPQRVDMSVLGGLVGQPMAYVGAEFQLSEEEAVQARATRAARGLGPNAGPERGTATKDMGINFMFYISGYIPNEAAWSNFFRDIGAPSMAEDPRFNVQTGRSANAALLQAELEKHLATFTAYEALDIIQKYGGMSAAFHTMEAAMTHPQTLANNMVVAVDHPLLGELKMVGMPSWFHDTPAVVELAPPTLGQHTLVILQEAGYAQGEMEELLVAGVV